MLLIVYSILPLDRPNCYCCQQIFLPMEVTASSSYIQCGAKRVGCCHL